MFTVPNQGTGLNDVQSEVFQADVDALVAGGAGTGVVSGCAVAQRAAGANMSVDVAAGTVCLAAASHAVSSTNVAIGANSSGSDRLDMVVSTGAGVVSVIAGTAAAAPKPAALDTTTYVLLAMVYVPNGAGSIVTANIIDKRVSIRDLSGTYTPLTRQVASGTGLTGGGDLTADRTLAVAYGTAAGTATQGNDARLRLSAYNTYLNGVR